MTMFVSSGQTNCQTLIHSGRVFNVFQENVTLPNDVRMNIDVIRHPGAAAIVPLTRNHTVIMLEQYRHAVGGTIWEIPAGTLNSGEMPLSCAQRELTEETGYTAFTWQKLGEITPVPGYSDERIQIFLATELTLSAQNLDSDEVLAVREVAFTEALKMISRGSIQDAKTICGLFMADAWLKEHSSGMT
jgi:ADP-ribose pyrophosphatase